MRTRWCFLVSVVLLFLLSSSTFAMLHPVQNRFLQRDPMGYADGMGLHVVLRGRPLSSLDPGGLKGVQTQIFIDDKLTNGKKDVPLIDFTLTLDGTVFTDATVDAVARDAVKGWTDAGGVHHSGLISDRGPESTLYTVFTGTQVGANARDFSSAQIAAWSKDNRGNTLHWTNAVLPDKNGSRSQGATWAKGGGGKDDWTVTAKPDIIPCALEVRIWVMFTNVVEDTAADHPAEIIAAWIAQRTMQEGYWPPWTSDMIKKPAGQVGVRQSEPPKKPNKFGTIEPIETILSDVGFGLRHHKPGVGTPADHGWDIEGPP